MLENRNSNGIRVLYQRNEVLKPDTLLVLKNTFITSMKLEAIYA